MAKTGDSTIFVDSNVLLAVTDKSRDKHRDAVQFLEGAFRGEGRLFVTTQIFREYLVVATRPVAANGLGLKYSSAVENTKWFQRFMQVLPEDDETMRQLLLLIQEHELKGKRIHDANLVASMTRHGLRKLKTFNPDDFAIFSSLEIMR